MKPAELEGMPMGIDISDGLQSTFGCAEFEDAAIRILKYLSDPEQKAGIPEWLQYRPEPASGWSKSLTIHTIKEIAPSMFAALCAAGWLTHTWFPKGSFQVTKEFIERVQNRRAMSRTA